MTEAVMKHMKTTRMGPNGENIPVDDAVANSVEAMIRDAPGTPLEKAVAQVIYMINFLSHSGQLEESGYVLLLQGSCNICNSMEGMTQERMNELIGLFENANHMAFLGVQRQ